MASTGNRLRSYLLAGALVAAAAAVSALLERHVAPVNLVMIFLFAVVVAGLGLGRGPSALTALAAVATFDFFFVPPHLTFAVDDAQYLLTFAGMLLVGLTISTLTARLREQAEGARARAARASALWELSRDLAGAGFESGLLHAAARHVRALFGGEAVVLLPGKDLELQVQAGESALFAGDEREQEAAEWARENGRPAGAGTPEGRGARGLYVPIRGPLGDVLGVLGVVWGRESPAPPEDPVLLLETFANQVAVALGRVRQEDAAEGIRSAPAPG